MKAFLIIFFVVFGLLISGCDKKPGVYDDLDLMGNDNGADNDGEVSDDVSDTIDDVTNEGIAVTDDNGKAGDDDVDKTGPCNPNPCTMANSDGKCTKKGNTFVCGCAANYTWDSTAVDCVADKKRTACTNIPENAQGAGDNADGKFEQTWDGTAWTPATFDCAWACKTNYTKDGETCAADKKRVDCANLPANAHGINSNADGKFEQVWNGTAWAPETFTCEWACDTNYTINNAGDACSANTQKADCTNIPANAHGDGDNADGKFEQTWNGTGWAPETFICSWACNNNFIKDGDSCIASGQRANCTNIPANAHGDGDNADGKFPQTWDGSAWAPATFDCAWACDTNYTVNGSNDACVANKNRENCTNIPLHAQGEGANADGKFEQTWDGSAWAPATFTCAWSCLANYTVNIAGDTCVANGKRENCTNIAMNAHGINDNNDGKFAQTWDGSAWAPATFTCEWACDTNYTLTGGTVCVADKKRVDCTNIPAHATGQGLNSDGKFEQTWDNTNGWIPSSYTCEWACDSNYTINGAADACVADTQRVSCTNIPTNAQGKGDNADGRFLQTWNGSIWDPATFNCTWECKKGYLLDGAGTSCVFQTVIYVDINAAGQNTGITWADAMTDLSKAISVAGTGQEIWVAKGTYHPTRCTTNWQMCEDDPGNHRAWSYTLVKGLAIYGGFDGTETLLTDRDYALNVTILSADLNDDDSWDAINQVWENRTDNAYHVFSNFPNEDLDSSTILDGFTISGGQADLEPYNTQGGGVNLGTNDSPLIRNCKFIGNVAISGGGAINSYNADVTVEDCTFEKNISPDGAAIYCSRNLTVTNCMFTENHTAAPDNNQRGGAIAAGYGTEVNTVTITNSSFVGNSSPKEGAAITFGTNLDITISGCLFDQNSDNGSGNGSIVRSQEGNTISVSSSIFSNNIGMALSSRTNTVTVINSQFISNVFVSNGAIEAQRAKFKANGCVFKDNHATKPGSGFAGLAGAMMLNGLDDSGNPVPGVFYEITNSVFDSNTANLWGGALLIIGTSPKITNCTFNGNSDSGGDTIVFAQSDAIFKNTILWGKTSVKVGHVGPFNFGPSTPVFSYSDIKGSGGSAMTCGTGSDESCWVYTIGTDGGNNIDSDPLFVGSGADPLALSGTSPCINVASNAAIPAGVTTDVIGNDRIKDTTVDMGAYEY